VIIKELEASFGKLQNRRLALKDGMNVIYAPNESGKSTWCAFIRAMLYGIDTSQRDRADLLSDKTRYRPWSGGAMEGTMRLEADGKDIILQRTAQGQAPMRKLRAVYALTGDPVEDPSGENLTGATADVFTRTAFIGQAGVKVSRSADLDRRIERIVSSGSEDTSYFDADRRLKSRQRKIKYNRTGLLPEAEARLEDRKRQLEELKTASDRLARYSEEREQLLKEEALLKDELAANEILEKQAARQRIKDAERSADEAELRANAIRQELTVNGRMTTGEDIARLRGGAAYFDAMRNNIKTAEDNLRVSVTELKSVEERISKSPLTGKTPEYISEQIEKAGKLEEQAAMQGGQGWRKWLTVGLLLLTAAGLIIGAFVEQAAFIPGLLSGGALLLMALWNSSVKKKRDGILGELGVSSVQELKTEAGRYKELWEAQKLAKTRFTLAKTTYETSVTKATEAQSMLFGDCKRLFPSFNGFSELAGLIKKTETRLSELAKAEYDTDYYNRLYCALFESYDGDPADDGIYNGIMPRYDGQRTKKLLQEAAYSLNELTRRYDVESGAIRSMGDPAVLSGEIGELEEEIQALKRRYGALAMAAETLKTADSELQTRFSPVISGIAGEYMSRMTGGRYESLRFDRSLDAEARQNGDTVSRGALSLSQGTRDQLYLSLRLAMCGLMLPDCPVILDDALTNFDDERMAKALDLLLELSGTRQIILFSCHRREAEYFHGNEKVNIIKS
jgi:hypothetical protein